MVGGGGGGASGSENKITRKVGSGNKMSYGAILRAVTHHRAEGALTFRLESYEVRNRKRAVYIYIIVGSNVVHRSAL